MKKRSKTNWDRIDGIREKDIDYSDNPKLTAGFFEQAVRWPGNKELISLRLDPDVLKFFRSQGKRLSDDHQHPVAQIHGGTE